MIALLNLLYLRLKRQIRVKPHLRLLEHSRRRLELSPKPVFSQDLVLLLLRVAQILQQSRVLLKLNLIILFQFSEDLYLLAIGHYIYPDLHLVILFCI